MAEYDGAIIALVFGVSGSGKTEIGRRLADATGWSFVDADDLHPPENVHKMRAGIALADSDRWPWLDHLRQRMEHHLSRGESAVLACSALKRAYRDRLLPQSGRVLYFYLKTPRAVLEQRLRDRRGHFFNPGLLDSQLSTLEEPRDDAIAIDAAHCPDVVVTAIRAAIDT